MSIMITVMIVTGEEHAVNSNCPVRLFGVGWSEKERTGGTGQRRMIQRLWAPALCPPLCAPYTFSWHHRCPHFTSEKTKPWRGACVSFQGAGVPARFAASGALVPGSGRWGSRGLPSLFFLTLLVPGSPSCSLLEPSEGTLRPSPGREVVSSAIF